MGTSSLYRGPKKITLLPSDYDPDVNPDQDTPDKVVPVEDGTEEKEPQQDKPENENSREQEDERPNRPSVKWGTARGSMRKAMSPKSQRKGKRTSKA